jgi:tagatose 1,6-diphosphate aldolase
MSAIEISRGKFNRINACANAQGVIAAAAMDQRGSLLKAIARARGADASGADLSAFKEAISRILTPHASAILLDPEYGLKAIGERAEGTGVLLSYEETGYDVSVSGRLPDLLPLWSVQRLLAAGADAIKILLYYNPDDDLSINAIKQVFVERVGDECAANDAAFFLEPVYYNEALTEEELARRKPWAVTAYMEEFSRPNYRIDVLKVDVPFNIKYVEGTRAFAGTAAYSVNDAMRIFREVGDACSKPFIFLSGGVSNEVFIETLELAAQAGTSYSGVLCGRATWQGGIPVYATQGVEALVGWLQETGVANIEAINAVLAKGAQPWWSRYGGIDAIRVVE